MYTRLAAFRVAHQAGLIVKRGKGMTSPKLSKTASNEKRKLTATYINTMAIAFFVAGVVSPYYALLATPNTADLVKRVQAIGTEEGVRPITILVVVCSWALSLFLHLQARQSLDSVED